MRFATVTNALENAAFPMGADFSFSPVEQSNPLSAVFPGAELVVGYRGEVIYQHAVGIKAPAVTGAAERVTEGDVYDVASLTKPMVTAALLMRLCEKFQVSVDTAVNDLLDISDKTKILPRFKLSETTLADILAHQAGFPAHIKFYQGFRPAEIVNPVAREKFRRSVLEMIAAEQQPQLYRQSAIYSDLGYIYLGALMPLLYQEFTGDSLTLAELAGRYVFEPLCLTDTSYRPLLVASSVERVVPTGLCAWRERTLDGMLCGEVHDENAWALGGIAGHAGVFSTAIDVYRFAAEMLRARQGKSDFLSQSVMKRFWSKSVVVPHSTWALGWDTPTPPLAGVVRSSAGKYFSSESFGHLGFTGTSIWIDTEAEVVVVMLSNRVCPSVENNRMKAFRPYIHDLVMQEL
ncbi:MAG: serine hydrolase [bacterium]|nr:serine hydrolase [bacterium]